MYHLPQEKKMADAVSTCVGKRMALMAILEGWEHPIIVNRPHERK
jgi:hypothetical protein